MTPRAPASGHPDSVIASGFCVGRKSVAVVFGGTATSNDTAPPAFFQRIEIVPWLESELAAKESMSTGKVVELG